MHLGSCQYIKYLFAWKLRLRQKSSILKDKLGGRGWGVKVISIIVCSNLNAWHKSLTLISLSCCDNSHYFASKTLIKTFFHRHSRSRLKMLPLLTKLQGEHHGLTVSKEAWCSKGIRIKSRCPFLFCHSKQTQNDDAKRVWSQGACSVRYGSSQTYKMYNKSQWRNAKQKRLKWQLTNNIGLHFLFISK